MIASDAEGQRKFEDYAYVLDYLPQGKPGITWLTYRAEPTVQLIGEDYFTLLEATTREGISVNISDRVFVGKGTLRLEISRIIGRIKYDDLTSTARNELVDVIEKIVQYNEGKYIKLFNTTQALTPRMHSLELIPGIGKKYMRVILRQRELRKFTSFEDLQKRTEIPDPVKLVAKGILEELIGGSKYRLFTRGT
jgi:putative nucleotide binding protein